ncbi:LysR family transcriptional regulator [Nakamurella leprariae]|uniref:LysR family transcriptional regulator n=1 Tax=Nakamurella leprariae TaxID=2803911 RepID=A0A939C2P3_9ACTN|nr:LysR family transcriptional regulator [Nakamurella leprariae]MBM9468312.1 LysR family transcriptional regulator [Nakamurella leprariae]
MLSARVPDLADLQLLLAVQRAGSLGAAGVALGISQQAASARIRALERRVGFPVLVRTRRGSRLTDAGGLLAQWADAVIRAATELDTGITSLRGERDAHLRVAASLTVAEHLMPRWLLALRDDQLALGHAPTSIELAAVNSETVVRRVRDAEVDLGFIESAQPPVDLPARVVAIDELVLVVPPGHRWAGGSIPPARLAATALISREAGSGTREALDTALAPFRDPDHPVAPALEASSTAGVRAAIVAGTAPGVLSVLAVADDLALGRLVRVPVTGLDLHRRLHAVWRSGAHPPAGPARDLVALAARLGTPGS